jgi:hypothetical protein
MITRQNLDSSFLIRRNKDAVNVIERTKIERTKKARKTGRQKVKRLTNIAQRAVKTKRKQGQALSERARRGRETRRKKATAAHPHSFDAELFVMLKDAPGTNLEGISRLTGFSEERVLKLEKIGVVERSDEGGFRINEGFLEGFRGENLERKTKRREELEITEYLMELEAQLEVQKTPPAGVA